VPRPQVRNVTRAGFCRTFVLGAALLVIGACGALAYSLEGSSWPGSTLQVQIQLGPSGIVLKDGSVSWNSVAENAFAVWNEQMARLKVGWTLAPPNTPASSRDGVTQVQFGSTVYGDSFGSNVLAVTLVSHSGGQMIECDVIVNSKYNFDSYRGSLSTDPFDLHRIAIHEFGHVLGLDHPDEAHQHVDAIMNSRTSDTDHLELDDVAGIQALYGRPANAPPTTGNGRMANISTRMRVGTGDSVMIGGFIIQGTRAKKIIIRALGPSTHLAGVLANPTLELHGKTGALLKTNDNWRSPQQQEIIATGLPPSNDLESAIVATLPGDTSYTAIVRGANNTTGVGLLEIYDLDSADPANSKLANISTRGHVGTGNDVLIGGFIIPQAQTKTVVVRAIGPSSGVPGPLANPTLELHNGNGALLATNDNYSYDYYVAINHFVPPDTRESAFSRFLAPGNYTAIVRGAGNTTGVALVEVYGIQ
jgi:matrixin